MPTLHRARPTSVLKNARLPSGCHASSSQACGWPWLPHRLHGRGQHTQRADAGSTARASGLTRPRRQLRHPETMQGSALLHVPNLQLAGNTPICKLEWSIAFTSCQLQHCYLKRVPGRCRRAQVDCALGYEVLQSKSVQPLSLSSGWWFLLIPVMIGHMVDLTMWTDRKRSRCHARQHHAQLLNAIQQMSTCSPTHLVTNLGRLAHHTSVQRAEENASRFPAGAHKYRIHIRATHAHAAWASHFPNSTHRCSAPFAPGLRVIIPATTTARPENTALCSTVAGC
jgi:hypothetical protein